MSSLKRIQVKRALLLGDEPFGRFAPSGQDKECIVQLTEFLAAQKTLARNDSN